ncbi:MAG TPA: TIGR04053 family radical SAM/SPASM domain-containing protein [Acidisarcina sp.]|nr:TIGR04053 family radical SAM/SPASM domain-containing protein [Acidisarcina sp.]
MIPSHAAINYDETPFLVIWEVTQACDLSCKHCRAAAQPLRSPEELSTEEGKHLIDQIADMHVPIFVFTGGDPIKRPDIFELIRYATAKGVHAALTPSATPLLTREVIGKLKEAGLARLAVSLDGSTAEIHDNIRQLSGAYSKTLQAIQWANEVSLPVQVHTTASRQNITDLGKLATLLHELEIVMWSVFFLVPVGRGQKSDLLTGEEFEQVFEKLYQLSKEVPFQIKTTEGMHYRRYILQQHVAELERERATNGRETPSQFRTQQWATRRVNDGRGFVFVSHTGNVYPSGFLPILGGSVRQQGLQEIYRDSPVFRTLRDLTQLHGKCGACEFKEICGGSRARAFALTGDLLAEESCCIYQPRNYHAPEPVLVGEPG